jgi:hypothetical protein
MVHTHRTWRSTAAAFGGLSVGLTLHAAAVASAHPTTYITFSQPVELPGVVLMAGTYLFDVPEPLNVSSVVRVRSRDGRISYFMGFTDAVEPPHGVHLGPVSLDEPKAGSPARITVWWPSGEKGRRFLY